MTRRRPRQDPYLDDLAIGRGTFGPIGWAPLPEPLVTQAANNARHAKKEERRARARVLRSNGRTNEQIAEEFEVEVRTVQRWLNKG